MKHSIGIVMGAWLALAAAGCATTKTTQTTQETPAPAPVAKKVVRHAKGSFTVEKGQSLWSIAQSEAGYGKSCNWPLIYKANKELVQDPDLIYPGQKLVLPKHVTAAESDKACEAAAQYGPYEPHSTPRTDVKLDF